MRRKLVKYGDKNKIGEMREINDKFMESVRVAYVCGRISKMEVKVGDIVNISNDIAWEIID